MSFQQRRFSRAPTPLTAFGSDDDGDTWDPSDDEEAPDTSGYTDALDMSCADLDLGAVIEAAAEADTSEEDEIPEGPASLNRQDEIVFEKPSSNLLVMTAL
jgi:hypothetical protein